MCVCVFGIYVLKIFVESWFWGLIMLIGSLVELHAWLHSYLCFSLLEKLFLSNLDSFSTPGYLSNFSTSFYRNLDSFSIARWIDRQTFWTLNSFSTAGGSIELLYCLFCWIIPRQILDSCISRCLLCSTHGLTLLDTSICRDLLNSYKIVQRDPFVFLLDISLDLSPKPLSLTPNFFLTVSSSFFKIFFTW